MFFLLLITAGIVDEELVVVLRAFLLQFGENLGEVRMNNMRNNNRNDVECFLGQSLSEGVGCVVQPFHGIVHFLPGLHTDVSAVVHNARYGFNCYPCFLGHVFNGRHVKTPFSSNILQSSDQND